MSQITEEILESFILRSQEISNNDKSPEAQQKELSKLKNQFSKEYKIPNIKNVDIVEAYLETVSKGIIEKDVKLETLISKRKIRSESGVAVITNQTKPFSCPGKCTYCPTEPNMPKSYLSNQPASMRAVLNKFDAFNQTQNRLASLKATGHKVSKIEMIIIGGTWSFLPKDYQEEFIKDCYDALNQGLEGANIKQVGEFFKCPTIERKEFSKNLEEALLKNERAKSRMVGLTLETRPDFITKKEIARMRDYGCTRVEIGVQSLFDDVQDICQRGHYREHAAKATKLLKDAGFKISYHLMPGLPGSNKEKDIETVQLTFQDDRFKPDLVKFYPCMVTKYSKLAQTYKEGGFEPLNEEQVKPILIEMKKLVPRYCRITRLVRDIPKESIVAGLTTINLRQIIHEDMKEMGIKCECIRCREIKTSNLDIENVEYDEMQYPASDGIEYFLTYKERVKDKLISLLRLRIPSQHFSKEEHFITELEGCALIREVHTYGMHTSLGKNDGNSQHFGFGKKLIQKAEEICIKNYGIKKLAVIAGVGVREYYEKLGYKKIGTYMIKDIA